MRGDKMGYYFTGNKVIIYLLTLVLLQKIIFSVFGIQGFSIISYVIHILLISLGLVIIGIYSIFRKLDH